MQNENVQFRAVSNASQFAWKFGETGNTDSKEKLAIYSYKKPGDYVVTLYRRKPGAYLPPYQNSSGL
jgi:PKD repeat protein